MAIHADAGRRAAAPPRRRAAALILDLESQTDLRVISRLLSADGPTRAPDADGLVDAAAQV